MLLGEGRADASLSQRNATRPPKSLVLVLRIVPDLGVALLYTEIAWLAVSLVVVATPLRDGIA